MSIINLLFFFFLLLPTYAIRFHFGTIPTTLLEILFGIIFIAWIIKNRTRGVNDIFSHICSFAKTNRLLFTAIALFLFASAISVFISLDTRAALGEWKAFYIEPIILFFIIITALKTKKDVNMILAGLILCGLATSLFAIYQHFTGWLVPNAFWANRDTYRVTAWYGFPNGVGLFLAPLAPLALFFIKDKQYLAKNIIYYLSYILIPTSILAIIFAKSTGGLVGVAAGIAVLFLLNKKFRMPTITIGIAALMGIFLLPADNPARQELLMQNRSGQIHIAMWKETINMLSDRPLFGAGLASYAKRVAPYHTTVNGEGIEIFHHPHNIFLTMWVNLGLLGVISFVFILVWFYSVGFSKTENCGSKNYLLASMTALMVTGFVDSPYIKNDLSMFFWILPALLLIYAQKNGDLTKS